MFLMMPAALLAQETRDVDAHEHGHSALNIAIEGTQVAMEFEVPGADIVRFEYEAETAKDRAKLDAAIAELSKPLSLCVLPDAAGCSVVSSTAGLHGDHEEEGEGHTEFHAEYLLPYASPLDNILLPFRFAPERRARAGDARAAALTLTDALGLSRDNVASATADRLSVGQQQRVALVRALIGAPPLIIADEPTSSLDAGSQASFLDLLFAQCIAAGPTLLMVSHDEGLASRFERSIRMEDIATLTREGAARSCCDLPCAA